MIPFRRTLVMVVAVGMLLTGQPAAPAYAEDVSTVPTTAIPSIPNETARESQLAPAKADEAARREALKSLRDAQSGLRTAQRTVSSLTKRLPALDRELAVIQAKVVEVRERHAILSTQLDAARQRMRDLAIASYVTGGAGPKLEYLLSATGTHDLSRRTALVDTANSLTREAANDLEEARLELTDELVETLIAETEVGARRTNAAAALINAESGVGQWQAVIDERRLMLDLVTAAAPVTPTDIPRLVLDAYQKAILAMSVRLPACRIPWTAVAALGRIESNHGRYRGARFSLGGNIQPPIIGIPLDGTNNTRHIADTDDGKFDFDTIYDRAVGPMQFIPSTWAVVGLDANQDGLADPNNIYDAALSAAYYLCRAVPSGGLDKEENLAKAYFSYNHSQRYVQHGLTLFRLYGAQAAEIR
ncbi:MAG: lytic murein transglycosylase [Acidimicrobiales bacterium]